jgi:uncharacterized protein YfeS
MSRRTSMIVAVLAAFVLPGCSRLPVVIPGGGPSAPVSVPTDATDQPTPVSGVDEPIDPTPHRTFATTFTDPLYQEQANEFAPFGSDEGSDTLAAWSERRSELDTCTTVRWLIETDDQAGALENPEENGPDVDGFVIGAGFGLIYLTGHIDSEGKQLTLDALRRTYSYYASDNPREQPVMIRDLEAFTPSDC